MAIILTNADVERLITMHDCIAIFDEAYRHLAEGQGLSRQRSDILIENKSGETFYDFKTMDGVAPAFDVAVSRIDSDVLRWEIHDGAKKRVQVPMAAGGYFSGLIFVFSMSTTELIAIIPDGIIQRLRVGATNGLAAKYLANESAETIGILGSGWQAGAQLMAITSVRKCKEIRCFSRSKDRRVAFCEEMSARIGTRVIPVSSAAEAFEGVDVALCATSSVDPVFRPEWVKPGMHISAVKRSEIPPSVIEKVDRVFIHDEGMAPIYVHAAGIDPPEKEADTSWTTFASAKKYPLLSDLVAGNEKGRQSVNETTIFINNIGTGYQFAVLGALLYKKARQAGIGKRLPSELFTQAERP